MSRIRVLFSLALAAAWLVVGIIVDEPASDAAFGAGGAAPNDYQFSVGFSNVQGQSQWYYLQWDGSKYSELTWDAANNRWRGAYTYCLVGRGWVHPDTNNAVIAWKAPRSGNVAVRGVMDHRQYTSQSDGVRTVVKRHSGGSVSKIWPSAAYQIIKPNFMAQHVFKTYVDVGDVLYFHVDQLGTTYHDSLNWDPRISYDFEPEFTLDQAELVMNPTDFQNVGIPVAQDTSFSIMSNGTDFDFYHTGDFGTATSKFRGTLDRPAQRLVYAKNMFNTNPDTDEQWWIANMFRTPEGHLLGFAHIEHIINEDLYTVGWWAIGLTYSTDGGNTFTRLGKIIGQYGKDTVGNKSNIYGVPYVVKDGYFHVYYSDLEAPGRSVQPAVARAPVADVLAAAKRGTVSPWQKYHNGGWTESGLNGRWSPIMPDGVWYSTHGDAAYSTYLGKYLMSSHTGHLGRGVFLAFSDDGVSYDVPSWVQTSHIRNKDSLSPYQTIVNVDGSDNGVVGQTFYVYYSYRFTVDNVAPSKYPSVWRWLYRQKVTLNRAGFDKNTHDASTEFTDKQGENGWHYLEYSSTAGYSELAWNSAESRWNGSSPYLLVRAASQHPDGGKDSVRVWTAPRTGTVRVGALLGISAASGNGADGVGVAIRKNGTQIWPAAGYLHVGPGTTIPGPDLQVHLAKGDRLYFHVNQNVSTSYDATSWVPVLSYDGLDKVTYDSAVDFSAVQGANGWCYREYDGSRYLDMTWDAVQSRWQGSATYLLIRPTVLHPDATRDSVRAWVAPKDGMVTVTSILDISAANGTGADGVKVKLMKNAINVWPASGYQTIGPGGAVPFPAVQLTVVAGDTLYFHVNQNGGAAYDSTVWWPAIAYR